jgi:hypothetical protein
MDEKIKLLQQRVFQQEEIIDVLKELNTKNEEIISLQKEEIQRLSKRPSIKQLMNTRHAN